MQEHLESRPDWTLDAVPLDSIDTAAARQQQDLFYLVTAASFIESGADLYTGNLAGFFAEDAEVVSWLREVWMREEIRHGHVLRDYVKHVWPEFDWEGAFASFLADYSQQCTVDEFEPTHSLELVARCVVETGTSTYYQSIAAQASEPVLAAIATLIRADEIGHYKHFLRYFRKYGACARTGRLPVVRAIARRVLEARKGDGDCALWHAFQAREPGADQAAFRQLSRRLGAALKRHYPVQMATKMLARPLDLPAPVTRLLNGPVARSISWALR